jgi:hypothetical protein
VGSCRYSASYLAAAVVSRVQSSKALAHLMHCGLAGAMTRLQLQKVTQEPLLRIRCEVLANAVEDSYRAPYEGSGCSRLHAPKNPRADVFTKKFARVDGPLAVIATKASVQIVHSASAMMQLFIANGCNVILNFQELALSTLLEYSCSGTTKLE